MIHKQADERELWWVNRMDSWGVQAQAACMDEADKITVANSKRSMQWMVGTVYVYGERDT